MSDIDLRFDGIFLVAALTLGSILYLLIAIIAGAVFLGHRQSAGRSKRVAGIAAIMALVTGCVALAYFGIWTASGTAHFGTDWADLMAVPWMAIFFAGCWALSRVR